jgi:hypothetical protein
LSDRREEPKARREGQIPIEVVLDDGSSRVAVSGNIIVQVRTGRLTVATLDRMITIWRERLVPLNVPVFGLFVIGPEAETPPATTHAHQRKLIAEVHEGGAMRSALVVEGRGIFVKLRRELLRSMTDGERIFYTAEDAARHLSREDGAPSEAALLAVVEVARTR